MEREAEAHRSFMSTVALSLKYFRAVGKCFAMNGCTWLTSWKIKAKRGKLSQCL